MIKIRIADLNIEIMNRYGFIATQTKDYETDFEKADISVSVSDEELEFERTVAEGEHAPEYLESTAVYRKIAEAIASYSAVVFHGAVIALGGKAYAVMARSGVGKTTHLSLWLREFKDEVHILNGDKPILRDIGGVIYACGTPWRGKEGFGIPEMLPLSGIAFLERAKENSAAAISKGAALMPLISQIYVPKGEGARSALTLVDKILDKVPSYKLSVNMDPEAAHVARRAFCK